MYIVCSPQIKPCIIKGGIVQQHNERDITSAKSSSASTIFDVDSDTALASRKRLLEMVSSDKNLCTSGHWLSPKFGYIERHGSGFATA